MATNLAVKALLGWVNSLKLCDAEIAVDDLQDGVIFLKLVYMIKKETNSCLNDSTEDRFRAVAEFIDGECRFSNTKGTSLYWENIRDGISWTAEIAKVLLLLFHHDIMNDRLTVNMLDCDVERELAHLCSSFVLESEGQVYLATGLDAYLRRRHLPISQEIFARSATTSTSNASTVSSLSDDESPVFLRAKTIKFVEMETVASTSVSSPLGDVMNTPKFQLKKMQREIIKERDYRDCLEKELASKIALIAQRESQLNQLKYRLDKLQEEQDDQEQVARAQINELQIKNSNLQRRLDEMLMQNKDLKNNASLVEHKVDKLMEENGLLSSQVRAARSRLAIFETEVGTLTEDHASAQEVWRKEMRHLQSELDQATAQKELLTEQIEILQGKISSLEDEMRRATKEDVGENMGSVMEMAQLKTEVFTYCKHIAVLEEEVSRLRLEIQTKKAEVEKIQTQLIVLTNQEQEKLLKTQQESAQQINLLQQQLASANADLKQHKETQAANLRLKESVQELQVTTLKEKEVLVQEKEVLLARILQAEKDHEALQERVEALVSERERLTQANQATERENVALRKLESVLQQELEILKMENEKLLKAKGEEIELTKRSLQEQLAAKSEAAQRYKAQMEKAVSYYNSKKLLFQKSQEEVDALKCSLEVKEREMQAIIAEKRLLQLDLDKAQSSEKMLSNRVASLEAQLALDDQTAKVQNKTQSNGGSATGWCFFEVPNANSSGCSRAQEKRAMSSDSLDQSSLEDSLNLKRACAEDKTGADSTQNNPTSAKRWRTTQKSSGCSEGDEPFYSLASARSQPNPSSANSARPVCMELFNIPAKSCASDQLIGLPGYRRSVVYAQPTSTFCVGAENEPDCAPEDWLRIAELQTRNKACLPHLKSSYPLETETGRNGPFIFTDEELRTGDPSDTIRRVSKMPGQVQGSHQHSLMSGQTGGTVSTRSHHLSLLPGQLPSKTINSHQSRSLKGTKQSSSMLSVKQTSLERTTTIPSCLPRPLTPKNNNLSSGPSSSTLHPALSPAEWKQSVMFMVENSPKSSNGLKKRLSKLRGSARKSPRSSLKKSPAQTSTRKSEEKMPSGSSRAVGQAGKVGSYKSPQVATKARKKSPQATSRTAKFPGLTTSAHKLMESMALFLECSGNLVPIRKATQQPSSFQAFRDNGLPVSVKVSLAKEILDLNGTNLVK